MPHEEWEEAPTSPQIRPLPDSTLLLERLQEVSEEVAVEDMRAALDARLPPELRGGFYDLMPHVPASRLGAVPLAELDIADTSEDDVFELEDAS